MGYCSAACYEIGKGAKIHDFDEVLVNPPKIRICRQCGFQFHSRAFGARKFCCDQCKLDFENHIEIKKPLGFYVYAWLENDIVFYVGKGTGLRFEISHGTASCEKHRQTIGDKFKIVIIRDGLTNEGALLLEATFIDILQPKHNIGMGKSNQADVALTISRKISQNCWIPVSDNSIARI